MIKEIRLKNWKSFKNVTFKPEGINILIGANASGKTNFLEALELMQKLGRNASEQEIKKIRGGQRFFKNMNIENSLEEKTLLECVIKNKKILEEKYPQHLKTDECIYEIFESNKEIKDKVENDIVKVSEIGTYPKEIEINEKITIKVYLEEILKEITKKEELSKITILDPIPREIRENTKDTYNNFIEKDCSNLINYISNLPNEERKKIEKELLKYIKQLLDHDIEALSFSKIGEMEESSQLYLEENVNGKTVKLHSDIISDGTLRFIAIIGVLLLQPSGSILAIEEVDNGIAPSKTKLLLDIINDISYEREIDVILTTHNTALMNYLSKELFDYIFFVYRDKKGNSQIQRIADIPRIAKLMSFGEIGKLMETNKILEYIQGEYNE